VVVVLAFVVWGGWRIEALPMFRDTSVTVTGLSPASHVSRADVLARAALDPQGNVWLLDRGAIERRIEAIPYVASAHVSVRPPASVTLEISERAIDGCVRDGSQIATIDGDRRVLAAGCDRPSAPLYEIRGPIDARAGTFLQSPELIALQNDRKVLAPAGDSYRSYAHDTYGELEATLRDGIVVKFGDDDDLERKQSLVGPILAQVSGEGRPVSALDVRAVATPVVEYRPEFKAVIPTHPHPVNKQ
jgi:cell division septal protein FtsQ